MALISELITELKLKTQEFSKELAKAEKEAESVGKSIGSKLSIGVAAGIGIAVTGFGLLLHSINENVESIDNLAHAASKFGTTVEAIQKLNFAGKLADVDPAILERGVNRLVTSLNGLDNGSKRVTDAFTRLGLSAADFKGLSLDQSFTKVLTEIDKIPDVLERTKVGVEIFGRSFSKVSELAKVDIAAASAEFEKFGGVISEEGAKGVSDYQESTKKLNTILGVFIDKLTVGVAPALTVITNQLIKAIENFGGMGKIADAVGKGIISVIQGAVSAFTGFLNIVDQAIIKLEQLLKLALQANKIGTLGLSTLFTNINSDIAALSSDIEARQKGIAARNENASNIQGGLQSAKEAIGSTTSGKDKLEIEIKASSDFLLSLAGSTQFARVIQAGTVAAAAREAAAVSS